MQRERDFDSLRDIVLCARRVLEYMKDVPQSEFEQNTEKQDSITYRILIMGEATKRLSPEFIAQHSNIPWRQIAAMRNFLVHEYDRIDLDVLWDVIHNNIPKLLNLLEPLLASE
jgi:uncharacterized protein with HEPN domain